MTHPAATFGTSFFVVVRRQKWIPQARGRIHAYGFHDQLTSPRLVGLGVLNFQDDPKATKSRLRDVTRSAVEEDGAEVIVLGYTAEYGFHEELRSDLGVPVLDAITASFKYAGLLADLTELRWTHSEVGGYESPCPDEVTHWGITDDCSNADVQSDEETT